MLVIPEALRDTARRRPSGAAPAPPRRLRLEHRRHVLGYATALVTAANVSRLTEAGGRLGRLTAAPIAFEPRVWYNPELDSTHFLVPGLIGFILMLTAVLSTALSVVREKERGTMEQLRVTSLRPGELIVGKTLPYLGISLIATVLILLAARVPLRRRGRRLLPPPLRGDARLPDRRARLRAAGLVAWSDTQAMAFQLGSLVVDAAGDLPLRLHLPDPLHAAGRCSSISYAVPARYFNVVLRGVILKGAGLDSYPRDVRLPRPLRRGRADPRLCAPARARRC